MNKLSIAFVGAMALMTFGCKKKGGAGDAVAKMEEFQKKMCDCKDKACSDKVNEEMTKWGTEMAKNASGAKDEKPDPDIAKKSADIMTKYTECMTKNMMAGAGGGGAAAGGGSAAAGGGGGTAAAGTCDAGFTAKAGFCIKLPAGTKGDGGAGMEVGNNKAMQYGWAGGDKGSDWGITVKIWPMSEFYKANLERVKEPPYQGKFEKEGKIGDTGGWATGESGPPPTGYAQRRWINSVNKNDKMQVDCNVTRANGTGAPTEDDVFEACKTITLAK